ncbi:MAG: nucleotidyl transferase AbiEii/AbiGii toxin family protein [Gordonia sp. (in: high G+C Gram-positive bacteria)]|uniref:nucleotidyl transferase AbiEii/AbiGii toxin family protein n=1 Tax=Gordonia sp. (in: high G+C Gram-positive bacteria) TaxID=84139 RepID=UPI0039E27B3C
MSSLYERAHHRRIESVLRALNAGLLTSHECYFGGGTAIALMHGEYRESNDVDFLVSARSGYRELRQAVRAAGLNALTDVPLTIAREATADQYGIRGAFEVDGTPIKFEIVSEGRMELERPGPDRTVAGITTLSPLDTVASKLLANDDRWADRRVYSRDVIDLAMLAPGADLLHAGLRKAETAYGSTVLRTLHDAVDLVVGNDDHRDRCRTALQMDVPDDELVARLLKLRI